MKLPMHVGFFAWLFAWSWDGWIPRLEKRRLVYMRTCACPRCGSRLRVMPSGIAIGRERSFRCLRCVIKFDRYGNRYPWKSVGAGDNQCTECRCFTPGPLHLCPDGAEICNECFEEGKH
jgi:hypothetical protein